MDLTAPRRVQHKPPPCVRLRELLALSKAEGMPFDDAWTSALVTMRREKSWPHATEERHQWQAAINASKDECRRCYLDQPSPFGLLARAILTHVAPEEIVADDGVVDALVLA